MYQCTLKVKNVKKIAILRASAIGDFIITLPALHAIRTAYPDAEIILLGKPWNKDFLVKGRTPIDRVIVVPIKKGIHEEKGYTEDEKMLKPFFQMVQQEQLDIAINFQGSGKAANPFIKQLGARLTVGLTTSTAEPLDRSIDFYFYQSEAIRYMEVAQLIGADPVILEPKITILEEDKEAVEDFLSVMDDKPYIVLHPFASDTRRTWPAEHYPELADRLAERGYQIVFSGSKHDKNTIDAIIAKMKHRAINGSGKLTLGALAALLSKAAVVIGADTGPIHLARAVNAPSVGIYWAPNLINWGPLTRRLHRPVVSWQMQCPCCGIVPNDPYPFEPKTHCAHNVSFVSDITVQQVLQAADGLLSSPAAEPPFAPYSLIHPVMK